MNQHGTLHVCVGRAKTAAMARTRCSFNFSIRHAPAELESEHVTVTGSATVQAGLGVLLRLPPRLLLSSSEY
jgi:hypothetical protein